MEGKKEKEECRRDQCKIESSLVTSTCEASHPKFTSPITSFIT